jgi:hypothetical protein
VRRQDPERDFDEPAAVIAEAARAFPTFVDAVRAQTQA